MKYFYVIGEKNKLAKNRERFLYCDTVEREYPFVKNIAINSYQRFSSVDLIFYSSCSLFGLSVKHIEIKTEFQTFDTYHWKKFFGIPYNSVLVKVPKIKIEML